MNKGYSCTMSAEKRGEYYYSRLDKSLGGYTSMKTPVDIQFFQKHNKKSSRYFIFVFLFFLACLIITVVALHSYLTSTAGAFQRPLAKACKDACTLSIVESIPENLTYPSSEVIHPSVYGGWLTLLHSAEHSLDIASSYWTLRGKDTNITDDPSSAWGENIFNELIATAKRDKFTLVNASWVIRTRLLRSKGERGVKIRIVQSAAEPDKNQDTKDLMEMGVAEVRSLNLTRLVSSGILHTKMWLVDGKHFYLGSANLDWRSLTQVKELGFMTYNCSCLGNDISKIFEAYWMLSLPHSTIPSPWPKAYDTNINLGSPANITINSSYSAGIYLASSPAELCPSGRSVDIDAILNVINNAKEYIYIEVMDYFPTTLYTYPRTYWPVIDDALRKAAFDRHVHVRLLAGLWKHTRSDLKNFLKSLSAINGSNKALIETQFFKVPIYSQAQARIPYARVNHDKFMVTDTSAYVGTSNWAADYFLYTGGIGYVIQDMSDGDSSIRKQLKAVFERDWYSDYVVPA